jgi:hypothetical protein
LAFGSSAHADDAETGSAPAPAPPAPEPKTSKVSASSNGEFAIKLVQAPNECFIEAVKKSDVAWRLDKCLGTPDDLYFVNDYGDRFWVLKTLPQKPAPRKKRRLPWVKTPVASLYDREGKLISTRTLIQLMPKGSHSVRHLTNHFMWLEGVVSVPGRPPRVNNNQVEFETLAGQTVKLAFQTKR